MAQSKNKDDKGSKDVSTFLDIESALNKSSISNGNDISENCRSEQSWMQNGFDNYISKMNISTEDTLQTTDEMTNDSNPVPPIRCTSEQPRYDRKNSKESKSKQNTKLHKKRVIFIRHAKSTWNEASEKSVDKVQALTKGLFESFYKGSTSKDGGRYIDAPLSDEGILQCMDLNRFIQLYYTQSIIEKLNLPPNDEQKLDFELTTDTDNSLLINKLTELTQHQINTFVFDNITIDDSEDRKMRERLIKKDLVTLSGIDYDQNPSCVLVSNLRRAIDSAIIGLSLRWNMYTDENLYICSCLQEFGKGPDCYTKTPPQQIPKISQMTQNSKRINIASLQSFYSTRIDAMMNNGSKSDDNITRFDRMLEFCRYVFCREEETVIVVGHSLWFQRFAKIFLLQQRKDKKSSNSKKNHISATQKLYNMGIVGFDLCRIMKGNGKSVTDYYGIDSRTMVSVYKGFEKMDKK